MIDDRELNTIPKNVARIAVAVRYQFVKRNGLSHLGPCRKNACQRLHLPSVGV